MDAEAEHHVHESPASMTGVLVVLAVLSAIGGFLAVPHYLEPLLPLPAVVPALEHFETPLVVVSVALALAGLARRRVPLRRRRRARRTRCAAGSPDCTACSPASTSSTRPTTRCIGRPLHWISDRVFLRLGDRVAPRRLAARARRARRGAPPACSAASRPATCSCYALLVLVGHRRLARVELAPWLTPRCSTWSCSCRSSASALLAARARARRRPRAARCRSA